MAFNEAFTTMYNFQDDRDVTDENDNEQIIPNDYITIRLCLEKESGVRKFRRVVTRTKRKNNKSLEVQLFKLHFRSIEKNVSNKNLSL